MCFFQMRVIRQINESGCCFFICCFDANFFSGAHRWSCRIFRIFLGVKDPIANHEKKKQWISITQGLAAKILEWTVDPFQDLLERWIIGPQDLTLS